MSRTSFGEVNGMGQPRASNDGQEHPVSRSSIKKKDDDKPWKSVRGNEGPLIMLSFQLVNGSEISYAYSDLRETRLVDAGTLHLCLWGFEKYVITITGRHLKELADEIGRGRVKTIREMGLRTFDHPEKLPAVEKIQITEVTETAH